jgi:hypothetical protein
MSALSRHIETPLLVADWQADVCQLLDEHHLVAWSGVPARRTQFAVGLGQFLGMQRDAEVCVFYGQYISDLDSFCSQLERSVPGPALERRVHGPRGAISLLRSRPGLPGRVAPKYRYYVWHDADHLLRKDHRLFGEIVDAMAGVAAEAEYVSDDTLLIHRAVFVGGSMLDIYHEDARGQFRRWLPDPTGEPFWQLVTGVRKPPFTKYRIDDLVR